jgi:hypothetical protein
MTQPRPTVEELLDAVRTFLEDDVLPTLDGRLRFHTRVAVNVLATVERELREGPSADARERAGLTRLLRHLGVDEPPAGTDADTRAGEDDVTARGRALAAAIRRGTVDIDDPRLLGHLRRTARADVAIANPRWLEQPSPG